MVQASCIVLNIVLDAECVRTCCRFCKSTSNSDLRLVFFLVDELYYYPYTVTCTTMDDDDDNFFSRLDSGNSAFQNRLRNAPRDGDDDDDDNIPMPAVPPSFEEEQGETPLQQLIRHWINERQAPDILPIAENVLSGLLDHIRRQVGKTLCAIPHSGMGS